MTLDRDTLGTGLLFAGCGLVLYAWFTQLSGHPDDGALHPAEAVRLLDGRVTRLEQREIDRRRDEKVLAEAAGRRQMFADMRASNQTMVTDLAASMTAALTQALSASCERASAAPQE